MGRSVPLLRVHRGDEHESLHRGALVVVERDRRILVLGDPDWAVLYRSTSKPLQTLVGVTSGAADAYGITPEELALAAGSHNASPEHLAATRSILAKAGVAEAALGCGGHWSIDAVTACRQREERDAPLPIWSNCSGKHALMLAAARHLGLPLETYLDPAHPLQVEIRRHIALLGGIDVAGVRVAVDGCGAPAFGLPLGAMALSLARFGAPEGLPADVADASRRVGDAMHAHPVMVGGHGRFDTDLIATPAERILAKGGADGVHGLAVPERRLGMAVKVEDGSDRGYRLVVLETLRRLGVLTDGELADIASRQCDPVIRTWTGTVVGRLEPFPDGDAWKTGRQSAS
jgi:L-asparaginase II